MNASRYMTIQQLEPFVKDMFFFADFFEKYGERVDFTVDMALEWANQIDWEKAARSMFGPDRQQSFIEYHKKATAVYEAEKEAIENLYMEVCTKANNDYNETTEAMRVPLNTKKDILQKSLNESDPQDEEAMSKIVTEWIKENEDVMKQFSEVSAPHKAARDEIMATANTTHKAALEAVKTTYNRSLASEFATLYIGG